MFKVLHKPSGQEILILDARWRRQIDHLRTLDKKDALVCPACEQPVRVRAGKYKRPHFAHKHLANCPFQNASPQLLKTRAVLYHWLVDKFGAEAITVEGKPNCGDLSRPVDCWVDSGEFSFAYLVFDRRMPPDEREVLHTWARNLNLPIQWVFIADLLQIDAQFPKTRVHLTTTERAFIQPSEFDKAWQTHYQRLGGSLHYLDPDKACLTTYRDLNILHAPQLYAGAQVKIQLNDLLAHTQTGEFVHPGELDRLNQRQLEIEAQKRAAETRFRLAEDFLNQIPKRKGVPLPSNPEPGESLLTARIGQVQVLRQADGKLGQVLWPYPGMCMPGL